MIQHNVAVPIKLEIQLPYDPGGEKQSSSSHRVHTLVSGTDAKNINVKIFK